MNENGDIPLAEIVRRHMQAYFRNHENDLPRNVYERLLPLFEKPLIETALAATGGNQLKTAQVLGINRNTLRKKITALGIHVPPRL